MQKVLVTTNLRAELLRTIEEMNPDKIFIVSDTNTHRYCFPKLLPLEWTLSGCCLIEAGEEHKTLTSLAQVWQMLSTNEATRRSLLINLGGGMITDLGGFAAASFKRGIRCLNLPTSLLGTVDAAVGGKTGIDFNGLKNEVGAFYPADAVLIDPAFYETLDSANLLSGFAEMLKHSLLDSPACLEEHLRFDADSIDRSLLRELVSHSIRIKQRIVEEDPFEKGIRKALNLGHTTGHALESMFLAQGRPVLHGYAVAWGLVCELYLSILLAGAPADRFSTVARYIKQTWGPCLFGCNDYEALYRWMLHDKKNNQSGEINFTLLAGVGEIRINQTASRDRIFEALDYLREG